jgi:site-specific DNA-adenine methylase
MSATPFTLPGLKSYPGGKGAEATVRLLINNIPPHEVYGELFLGGGAIMRHKRPADRSYGDELSDDVLRLWESAPAWVQVYKRDGLAHLERIAAVNMVGEESFLFLDPPHLDETLKGGRAPYAHRMPYADHVRLLLAVKQLHCNVMLCGLPNLLYENQLRGWRTFQYENMTRRGLQTEQVWMNYEKPGKLHDCRYVGENFRHRERLQRRAKSIRKQLDAMPDHERQFILESILQ